ncbi:MAG: nucleotide sugar dehydrogenase [Bacteroidales bacterium]
MPSKKIAIVGLGYVGLPLAIEFSKHFQVIGYDINHQRVSELKRGYDATNESSKEDILQAISSSKESNKLTFTSKLEDIQFHNIYIVTVPTPINSFNSPDLTPLKSASSEIGKVLQKDDIVIYESTTFPGCTEEICIPILEKNAKLKFNVDFFVGYSPERINPGDKINTLPNIKKVTSGSTPEIAEEIDKLYRTIILAGTHKAPSIKVAEASKIVENAQRDVNISFVNELALIFDRMNIDTHDVLDAAATKWNFLKFQPGLVGGHCISVDPYYLASKAESLGYFSQVILSGRRVNNSIAPFIANKVVKLLIKKKKNVVGANILILGITFKENCPDIRNTKVVDIYNELLEFGAKIDIFDPWANENEVKKEFNITLSSTLDTSKYYDAIILTVGHKQYKTINFATYHQKGCVIFDCKQIVDKNLIDGRL